MTIHFQWSRAFWIEPVTGSLELVVNFNCMFCSASGGMWQSAAKFTVLPRTLGQRGAGEIPGQRPRV